MEFNDFTSKLGDVFEDTDLSILTPETKFRDLDEWSSIVHLSLIAFLDEEFDIQIDSQNLEKLITLGDLFNYIQENQ